MFHDIPPRILRRMQELEAIDARDRLDGTPRSRRLRQVGPETGRFLALLACAAPPGAIVEIGTSGGYSTMWLALACAQGGRRLTTFEVDPDKAALARETFREAGMAEDIDLVLDDARHKLRDMRGIALCFLDAEKDAYTDCYEAVLLNLVAGGFLVADNAVSHQAELADFLGRALGDRRVDALIIPLGKGVLVCRKP